MNQQELACLRNAIKMLSHLLISSSTINETHLITFEDVLHWQVIVESCLKLIQIYIA